MEYTFNLFDFNHFWWFDILAHYTIVCTLYVFLCIVLILNFCCVEMLGLESYFHYKWKDHIGLDMIYDSRYFHVMFCMCGDNNSYGCWHRSTQQKTWAICEVMVKVLLPIMTSYVLSQTHIQFVITKTCKIWYELVNVVVPDSMVDLEANILATNLKELIICMRC